MTINRKTFFDGIRDSLFSGRLNHGQVAGIDAVIDEWERRKLTDLRHLAYMLATDYWETAHTMQPIGEYGGDDYFFRMYDMEGERPGVAERLGNTQRGDGVKFHGRGLVQLTGRRNYQRMTELIGKPLFDVDLIADPESAKRLDVAVAILFEGMLNADSGDGDFTGKSLDDFFNADREDWEGARQIINGNDRASEIAEVARAFHVALRDGAGADSAATV